MDRVNKAGDMERRERRELQKLKELWEWQKLSSAPRVDRADKAGEGRQGWRQPTRLEKEDWTDGLDELIGTEKKGPENKSEAKFAANTIKEKAGEDFGRLNHSTKAKLYSANNKVLKELEVKDRAELSPTA